MTKDQFARYPSLEGMPVVISGGASGIGADLVRHFAGQGAKVGFVDIAGKPGEALADELNSAGATVKFTHCDITDIPAYQRAIAGFAKTHGDALALVNNAAHDERHALEDLTEADWDQRVAVNLKHAVFAIQAVTPGMIAAGKGSIINFGSISWMILSGNMPAYTTSKAAMHGLSRSLARDLGPHGIRLNTLVPGFVMTERQLTHWIGDKENRLIDETQALKGRVLPEDVARMALFLAADDSRMISAQDFIVDGGWAHG
ncbi:SDR family NAD(P)-dependent oxidoreductase [Mariluticola halotolerans]|uniref:SDR family NAD(P)-dependent oxidoreductase n=1 Tax=Mariluticola halotolerans TaxID=2909283 RepID=UPI0026E39594|nr:SDR family oxidoreductase [Mariluticola halotolerans]UJQ93006.1 SDR family oxidoreductase [Mariluticola halotolerans]